MQMQVSPTSGRRRLTEGHVVARRRSSILDRSNLPNRAAVKSVVIRVGRLFGWPSWAGSTLHMLLEFCASWDQGNLTVYPSNARLSHELAIGRRALNARLFRLGELGLIAFHDGPGCRRGKSPDGQTYGIDLAPLAYLFPEWMAALKSDASHFERIRTASRTLRHRLADVHALLCVAPPTDAPGSDPDSVFTEFKSKAERAIASGQLDEMDRLISDLGAFCIALEKHVSGMQSDQVAPGSTAMDMESTMPSESVSPDSRSDTFKKSSIEASARVALHACPALAPLPSGGALSPATADPATIMAVAPELRETLGCSADENPDAEQVVEACRWHALSLGVSQRDWGEACGRIGRMATALAVALVLNAMSHKQVVNPAGLITWFIKNEMDRPGFLNAGAKSSLVQSSKKHNRNKKRYPI